MNDRFGAGIEMAKENEELEIAVVQTVKWVTCPYCSDVHEYGDADLPSEDICQTCGNHYRIPE